MFRARRHGARRHQEAAGRPAPSRGTRLFQRPDTSRGRHRTRHPRGDRQVPVAPGPVEAPDLARPEPSGARMTEPPRHDNPLEELHFALAEADAQRPPTGLGDAVLGAALAARSAGRPVDEPSPLSAVEAFRRAVASVDGLLTSLEPADWHRPALRALDVQQLVGHLTGVERDFQAGFRSPDKASGSSDHVTSTDPVAMAQRGRPPALTLDEWRVATTETLQVLRDVE